MMMTMMTMTMMMTMVMMMMKNKMTQRMMMMMRITTFTPAGGSQTHSPVARLANMCSCKSIKISLHATYYDDDDESDGCVDLYLRLMTSERRKM